MRGYFYLNLNNENFIIIFGEKLRKSEIIFKGKPSFYEAIKFSDSSPSKDVDVSIHCFPLACTPNETFHFHDPLLYQKFTFIINHHSLIIIDSENKLTNEAVYNIFNYFLVKKGKRMLFLTNVPNNKIIRKTKDKQLTQNKSKTQTSNVNI